MNKSLFHFCHNNIILFVGKFNILGRSLDIFRNDGFCNRTPDTLAQKFKDGRKTNGILKKSVNLGSHQVLAALCNPSIGDYLTKSPTFKPIIISYLQYSSIITSKRGACTRMETRHEDILFTSRVCVEHVSRSV